ncbi:unnamed protein product [Arctogadus glacialis]
MCVLSPGACRRGITKCNFSLTSNSGPGLEAPCVEQNEPGAFKGQQPQPSATPDPLSLSVYIYIYILKQGVHP